MKWSKIKLVVCLAIACMACACVSNSDRIENALMEGNLKEAEMYLKKIDDRGVQRYYGGVLIDEYLAIDNLDKAIFVFDKITGHCSMYQMQYTSLYDSDSYTQTYSKKLYDALLKEGRYEEAWNYHRRSYDGENYSGNAPDYFAYMTDVVVSMCNSGRTSEATQFIKKQGLWFLKNVDNSPSGDNYTSYRYDIMRSELNKVLNSVR